MGHTQFYSCPQLRFLHITRESAMTITDEVIPSFAIPLLSSYKGPVRLATLFCSNRPIASCLQSTVALELLTIPTIRVELSLFHFICNSFPFLRKLKIHVYQRATWALAPRLGAGRNTDPSDEEEHGDHCNEDEDEWQEENDGGESYNSLEDNESEGDSDCSYSSRGGGGWEIDNPPFMMKPRYPAVSQPLLREEWTIFHEPFFRGPGNSAPHKYVVPSILSSLTNLGSRSGTLQRSMA
ncbi:hypothetical protein BV22DRAFT_308144 [Leucogyrophana mollusca]|uniref:Uncharacterized protein n=1 Tax=Leucogyrophana mollusca TaxID=85980 RepID=A0ACB8BNB2_9AGAM|nr:hypothetical protein BV22DRAFT_308144 [Leucogyrophana mollusca]